MHKLQLNTDCEGPLALNDNAFELCRDFLRPRGDYFFTQVSRYNDFLVDVRIEEGRQRGDTLKLILPFLKALGLTDAQMRDHAAKTLKLMPGAADAYRFLNRQNFPVFAISTSYCQFSDHLASESGFDSDHVFCTRLNLDGYALSEAEGTELRRLLEEIVAAPAIEWAEGAASPADLPGPVQDALGRLERIFSERLPAMDIGAICREVTLVGGPEKPRALQESLEKTGLSLKEAIYVGDGSTGVEGLAAVKAGGGLAISFNGDRRAVEAAEVVVVSDSAWSVALLANIYRSWGKEGVLEVAAPESPDKSRYLVLPEEVIEPIATGLQGRKFNLYLGSNPNREKLVKESAAMRRALRGGAIAGLG